MQQRLLQVVLLSLLMQLLKHMLRRQLLPRLDAPMAGKAQLGMMPTGPVWWGGSLVVRL
jgi:hypothetical protein